jgi:hypothetical protein
VAAPQHTLSVASAAQIWERILGLPASGHPAPGTACATMAGLLTHGLTASALTFPGRGPVAHPSGCRAARCRLQLRAQSPTCLRAEAPPRRTAFPFQPACAGPSTHPLTCALTTRPNQADAGLPEVRTPAPPSMTFVSTADTRSTSANPYHFALGAFLLCKIGCRKSRRPESITEGFHRLRFTTE